MVRTGLRWTAATIVVAFAGACGSSGPASPASPGAATSAASTNAAGNGATLKVDPPTLTSPIGGARLTDVQATLTFQPVTGKFVQGGESFTYRVELQNAAGVVLETQTGTATAYRMKTTFDADTTYKWRARAEFLDTYGPWSALESFKSLVKPAGYIKGAELYDPLDAGRTVGSIAGPTTWIPGVGLRMDSESSYVEYLLPQTLTRGEFSALITGLAVVSDTEDPKDRLFSMRQGAAGMNSNIYRMTIDKRGNGAIAFRFLTGSTVNGTYIESSPSERVPYGFNPNLTYFYRVTWGNGLFRLLVKEGGVAGRTIYDLTKGYGGEYAPNPHMVYAGSPYAAGDRGSPATVVGMVISQIWVSANPRPTWAQ